MIPMLKMMVGDDGDDFNDDGVDGDDGDDGDYGDVVKSDDKKMTMTKTKMEDDEQYA